MVPSSNFNANSATALLPWTQYKQYVWHLFKYDFCVDVGIVRFKLSALLVPCEKNPPFNGGFPYKETVIWRHDVFFSVNRTKLWNKQWFETTPRPCDMAVPGMHQQVPSESCYLSNCWTLRLLQHIYFIFILCASPCLKVAWKYICFWYRFLTWIFSTIMMHFKW